MIKLKIAQMREQFGLPEYDGNFDKLRLSIMSLKSRLGFNYNPPPVVKEEPEPLQEKKPISISDKLASLKKKV